MHRRHFLAAGAALALAGCSSGPARRADGPTTSPARSTPSSEPSADPTPTEEPPPTPGTAAEILARSTVPVLCYHQLREHQAEDSAYARTMITPPAVLTAQLQALRDGGYTPVTGPALVDHLQFGTGLPERPVLLTFDDGSATHATVGLPALSQFGYPATFFPMTVVLDKPNWLSNDQLRELDAAGMTIGAHSWDHQRMDRISGDQWAEQVDQPRQTLADVLGHPVDLLAYPHGVWNQDTLDHAASAGYRAAFQLSDPTDPAQPLLTIRRIMPPPTWDGATLLAHLESDF
ncbi:MULTISPECIES: polysaccharide deacetylase family protein [unclassified Modestobacter]